jgi:hypothetical protein
MAAASHGLFSVLYWDVDETPAPRIHWRPGASLDFPERASLRVGSRTVELYMAGTPGALRAWAERVIALADDLATGRNGSEVAGDE